MYVYVSTGVNYVLFKEELHRRQEQIISYIMQTVCELNYKKVWKQELSFL